MRTVDAFGFSLLALRGARSRSGLMLLAMSIGVASVVLLTALGEGARRFVANEFSSLGSNLVIVIPGKVETTGDIPPLVGGTPRDLTLGDAQAILRSSAVEQVAPLAFGAAPVSYHRRSREVSIMGSTAALLPIRDMTMARGRFLPVADPTRENAIVVLGDKLKQELFGNQRAVGEWLRIHDRRFRVIGVLKPQGESLGMDIGDIAVIPVASAQSLFNSEGLFRVLVQVVDREAVPRARQAVIDIIRERHEGEEDVTVISQDALLSTFDDIFRSLTYTVSGIASISLVVAGILIMNVMLVAVSQRTAEIGLLKALGGRRGEIMQMFLIEAGLLSIAGSLIGVIIAYGGVWLMGQLYPGFPLTIPLWSLVAALAISLVTGMLFGILPARRAAGLDPVVALAGR